MGVDSECLHDLRVALRRTKAALRFFKPVLRGTSAGELRQSITSVCDKLSIARDSHVWMEFLRKYEAENFGAGKAAWEDYFTLQQSKNQQCMEELRQFLQSEEFKKPFRQVNFFARIEIPRLERERGRKMADLKVFTSRRLYKAYDRLPRLEKSLRKMTMEELHNVRRECRRVRYAAEFATPALGRKALMVERKLNGITDLLGKIHDIDVYLQMHAGSSLVVSAELRRHLISARRKAIKKTVSAWNEVNSQGFRNIIISICRFRNKNKTDKKSR
jgi:CHAD domain-containing protein